MNGDQPTPTELLPPAPTDLAGPPPTYVWPPPPRPKFQHRYRTHLLLFGLTLLTTTWAGSISYLEFAGTIGGAQPTFLSGLWYALPLLIILGAHEFGHYTYCRLHNVDATLPYFIPAPLPLTGTFGAVIRIREAFPSKRALFDIGVAGPIAGFVALLPFLYWGITLSKVVQLPNEPGAVIYFGEPLLFKFFAWLHFGNIRDGYDIILHPLGFAAWWGMLATALNLMPFGQLDGGHIVYALLGRRAGLVSVATLAAAVLLTLRSTSWVSMAIMMLVMAMFLGVRHPRIVDEDTPLDPGRVLIALLAFVMFVLCFTPVPIETLLK